MPGPWSLQRESQTDDADVLVESILLPVDDMEVIARPLVERRMNVRALLPDGTPLLNFSVRVDWTRTLPSGNQLTQTLVRASASDGSAQVTFTGSQPVSLVLDADAEHVGPEIRTTTVPIDSTTTSDLVVKLAPTGFMGSIRDENGSPLSGWRVQLRSDRRGRGGLLAEAGTDKSGVFTFHAEDVPRRTSFVEVVKKGAYLPFRSLPLDTSSLPLHFVARRGGRVEGTIVIDDGDVDPSSMEAWLTWTLPHSEWEEDHLDNGARLEVNPDGSFVVQGVPTDRDIWLQASPPGSSLALRQRLDAPPDGDPILVRLGPFLDIAGRVDVQTAPGEETHVGLIKLDSLASEQELRTDEAGAFRINKLPPGEYAIELTRTLCGSSSCDQLPIHAGDTSIHWRAPALEPLAPMTPLPSEHIFMLGTQVGTLRTRCSSVYDAEGPLRARAPSDVPLDVTLTSITPGSSWVAYAKDVRAGQAFSLTIEAGKELRVRARVPWSNWDGSHRLSARGPTGLWPLLGTAANGYETMVPDGSYDIILFAPNGAHRVIQRGATPGGEPIDLGDLEPIW
ncbi:MAG: hypothetical protein R3F05_21045, partial [Planctomycetota bacterium]